MNSERENIFVSYTACDVQWAEWIAWTLEEAGHRVVLQKWDFLPGSNFVLEMQSATASASRTIAVLSPDYLKSAFAGTEWAAAFARDPVGLQRRLIPVVVRPVELEGVLRQIVHVELTGRSEEAAAKALVHSVSEGRLKPANSPPFPGKHPSKSRSRPPFPTQWPKVFNVPIGRNPNFVGRETLLKEISRRFRARAAANGCQAIFGLAGAGKTQVAIEYVYRSYHEYDVVWWVHSEAQDVLTFEYLALLDRLGEARRADEDPRDAVERLRNLLERNAGYLLIFDNAISPSVLSGYLPRNPIGDILVTSRNPSWDSIGHTHRLRTFERKESMEYLRQRLGTGSESSHLVELAEELGDLPLALEHAAAYIMASAITVPEYLVLLRENRTALMDRVVDDGAHERNVGSTWDLSFRKIETDSKSAPRLLELCSLLPSEVSRVALAHVASFLPTDLGSILGNPLELNQAISLLRRYSLVDVEGEKLAFHRLLLSACRSRFDQPKRLMWKRTLRQIHEGLSRVLSATDPTQRLKSVQDTPSLLAELNKIHEVVGRGPDWKASAEEALTIAEALQYPEPVLVLSVEEDAFGRVTQTNGGAEGFFGYSAEQLASLTIIDLCLPEDRNACRAAVVKSLRDESTAQSCEITCIAGTDRNVLVQATFRAFREGAKAQVVAVLRSSGPVCAAEITESITRLRRILEGVIRVFALAVERRDPYTAGHQSRVAKLALRIAQELGCTTSIRNCIQYAAELHDIGKLSIPSEILSKPSRLTSTEVELIKSHAETGADILRHIEFPWPLAEVVLQHHEHCDGSGYPRGLKGDAIRLEAKIIGAADVTESMASHRPYRPALGLDAAIEELRRGSGSKYDSVVVQACCKVLESGFVFGD